MFTSLRSCCKIVSSILTDVSKSKNVGYWVGVCDNWAWVMKLGSLLSTAVPIACNWNNLTASVPLLSWLPPNTSVKHWRSWISVGKTKQFMREGQLQKRQSHAPLTRLDLKIGWATDSRSATHSSRFATFYSNSTSHCSNIVMTGKARVFDQTCPMPNTHGSLYAGRQGSGGWCMMCNLWHLWHPSWASS